MLSEKQELLGALDRAIKALEKSTAFKRAGENARRAHRKAYRGPVVKDERAMADLVGADRRRCKNRIGYRNWPGPRNSKGGYP